MWQNILCVGMGSALGGISRYLLSTGIKELFPVTFPWGTFFVNILGCFLAGAFSGLPDSSQFTAAHRLFFAVGFCGSFTTFSTFSFENLQLLVSKAYALFALYTGTSLLLGIGAAWLGYLCTTK